MYITNIETVIQISQPCQPSSKSVTWTKLLTSILTIFLLGFTMPLPSFPCKPHSFEEGQRGTSILVDPYLCRMVKISKSSTSGKVFYRFIFYTFFILHSSKIYPGAADSVLLSSVLSGWHTIWRLEWFSAKMASTTMTVGWLRTLSVTWLLRLLQRL